MRNITRNNFSKEKRKHAMLVNAFKIVYLEKKFFNMLNARCSV